MKSFFDQNFWIGVSISAILFMALPSLAQTVPVSQETPAMSALQSVSVATPIPLSASSTPLLEQAELNGVTGDTSFLLSQSDTNTSAITSRLDHIIALLTALLRKK